MDNACIAGLENVPPEARWGVLTIGNFDGVHLGHQRILRVARGIADAERLTVSALTFDPPPELVLHPDAKPQRLLPPAVKAERILEAGADYLVTLRTDEALLGMAPEEFVERIILRCFAPRHIVEGPNFFFGLARSGNVNTLRRAGDTGGFAVKVVEPVCLQIAGDEERVSSTLIRGLIRAGRVADAAACLGHPHALYGPVVPGQGHGRHLEFPTTNLDPGPQVCPADGVYAGWAVCGGRTFPAAISIGEKPTLGPADRTIEAHLIGAEGDFYGREIQLGFVQRLRDQEQFPDSRVLKAQIAKDVARVRDICAADR